MAPIFPSIQSFFRPKLSTSAKTTMNSKTLGNGDGFTSKEVEAPLQPQLHQWHPKAEYKETDIGNLVPGPGCVALVGRVVNIYHQQEPRKVPNAAKGCLRLVIKDDTGTILVRVYSFEFQIH